MARGRYHMKFCTPTVLLTVAVFCGSLAVVVVMLSVFRSHLLNVQLLHKIWAPPQTHHTPLLRVKNNVAVLFKPVVKAKATLQWLMIQDVPKYGESRIEGLWGSPDAGNYNACTASSSKFTSWVHETGESKVLIVEAGGDLPTQKAAIANAVAVARLMDATITVPSLVHSAGWNDSSKFSDIFDVEHFILTLAADVPILKELPPGVQKVVKQVGQQFERIENVTVTEPRNANRRYFDGKLVTDMRSKSVIRLTNADYRLSDTLDPDLQKLRCRVSYRALLFSPPIREMGKTLIQRLRRSGKGGRYIAVYIRFDPEFLASSGCYFGGGDKERKDLKEFRRRWRTTFNRKDPNKERRKGMCPLSPTEVGLLLRAMGYGEDSLLYIVITGGVLGGEETLLPLKQLFPYHWTSQTIATKEELKPFISYPSRLAAIDYQICEESDAFVANSNGDWGRILAGHRRVGGHRRTIRPNFMKLSLLFIAKINLGWSQFASKLRIFQEGYIGDPKEKSLTADFYENPAECICQDNTATRLAHHNKRKEQLQALKELQEIRHEPEPDFANNPYGETIEEARISNQVDDSVLEEEESKVIPEDWTWIMN